MRNTASDAQNATTSTTATSAASMRLASTLATHELSRMQGVCEFSRLSPTVRAGILPQLMLGALSFSLRTLVLLLALASPSIAEAQFSDVELKLLRYGQHI